MSPLLINIALESAVRRSGAETLLFRNHCPRILLSVADDKEIVGNSTINVKEELINVERSAIHFGLRINESLTKYMVIHRTAHRDS